MEKKLFLNLSNLISLQYFNAFSEYFISISIIYLLILGVLSSYNIYGLMIQRAFSECFVLILLMAGYLVFNDDLLIFNFLTFNNSFINDHFAFFTKILICIFSTIYFLIISNSLKEQKLVSFEYLLIILFAILGILLMCSSNDLLTSYLAIELSSLAFYILASFRKVSSYSIESGIKYFIVGAISSSFFLLGSSFIYGSTGSINFSDFQDLFELSIFYFDPYVVTPLHIKNNELSNILYILMFIDSNQLLNFDNFFDIRFIEFGLILILFSLFIKLALAPFHLWSLDVYEGSPTNSTFFFAVITKLSIFVLLVRFCYQSFFILKNCWQFYLLWIGFFSIFVGSFGGLKQRKLKTLLAYSSIGHMGYILIALSTSTFVGTQMFLFYIFVYMLSSLVVWNIILLLRQKKKIENKYNKELSDLILLKKSNSTLALFLSITMFSIAGIPPIIGFIAKMNIFLSVIGISFYFIAFASIICSVASTFYYIRIIKVLYFENLLIGKLYYPIKTLKTFVLSILVFSLIYLFLNPTVLYRASSILLFQTFGLLLPIVANNLHLKKM